MRAGTLSRMTRGMVMKNRIFLLWAAMVALFAPVAAHATPGTYDDLTAAVDWSDAIVAIMAVAALLAAVLVIRKGVRFVLRMIG